MINLRNVAFKVSLFQLTLIFLYSLLLKNFPIKRLIENTSCEITRCILISRDKNFLSNTEINLIRCIFN